MNYHDRPEKSSSEVAAFLSDPIEWYHIYVLKDWPRMVATKEMELGTAVHSMVEHRGVKTVVRSIPATVLNEQGHCKGKTWTDWKAANPAQIYLKPGETNPLTTIWQHLIANAWCRAFVEHAEKEVEHFWNDTDLGACRVKFDAILNGTIVDWKTTSKTCARTFAIDAVSRFYDVRLALYRRGYRDLFGCNPEIVVVAIETSGGTKVTPYRMPDAWLDDAEAKLILAVDDMRRFDLSRYLDCSPVDLVQPRYSVLDLESVE